MVKRDRIVEFLNDYLEINKVKDYGTNGLQVIGKDEVKKVVVGVSASLELFEKAAKRNADMIIVHHGLFWESDMKDELTENFNFSIKSILKKRLKIVFDNDINLLAYHLPLDKHPKVGNNILILKKLGLEYKGKFGAIKGNYIGVWGETKPVIFDKFIKKVNKTFDVKSQVFNYKPKRIRRVAIVSGGGAALIKEVTDKKFDLLITGEPLELTEDFCKEGNVSMIFSGHHNTEKFGIQAIGNLLKKKFRVDVEFIDVK